MDFIPAKVADWIIYLGDRNRNHCPKSFWPTRTSFRRPVSGRIYNESYQSTSYAMPGERPFNFLQKSVHVCSRKFLGQAINEAQIVLARLSLFGLFASVSPMSKCYWSPDRKIVHARVNWPFAADRPLSSGCHLLDATPRVTSVCFSGPDAGLTEKKAIRCMLMVECLPYRIVCLHSLADL